MSSTAFTVSKQQEKHTKHRTTTKTKRKNQQTEYKKLRKVNYVLG
jgi:hypothetical protein